MICIEMPLWLAIMLAVWFCLVLLYLLFSDFIAKLTIRHKYFKEEKENKDND